VPAKSLRLGTKLIGRKTDIGARTLVYGASAGFESHGQCIRDCMIKPSAGLAEGEASAKLQKLVWEELKEKLEAIHPNDTSFS
jgi:hypothetical protein